MSVSFVRGNAAVLKVIDKHIVEQAYIIIHMILSDYLRVCSTDSNPSLPKPRVADQ